MEFLQDYKCSSVDSRNKKLLIFKRFFMSHVFGIPNGFAASHQNEKIASFIESINLDE